MRLLLLIGGIISFLSFGFGIWDKNWLLLTLSNLLSLLLVFREIIGRSISKDKPIEVAEEERKRRVDLIVRMSHLIETLLSPLFPEMFIHHSGREGDDGAKVVFFSAENLTDPTLPLHPICVIHCIEGGAIYLELLDQNGGQVLSIDFTDKLKFAEIWEKFSDHHKASKLG